MIDEKMTAPVQNSTSVAPLSNLQQISEKIDTLQQMLQKTAPGYEGLLHVIHQAIKKDEELGHLLTEEQIGVIMKALTTRKNIVIAEEKTKAKGRKVNYELGNNL